MERLTERDRTNPYFIEYYHDRVGPLELSEEDYARGQKFVDGLIQLHNAFEGSRDEYAVYFTGRIKNGIMVVEPSFPVRRTVTKQGSSYEWMVKPETTEAVDLLVIDYLRVVCDHNNPDVLIAEGTSPAYRCYGGEPSIEEIYSFDPTQHKIAMLQGNFSPNSSSR